MRDFGEVNKLYFVISDLSVALVSRQSKSRVVTPVMGGWLFGAHPSCIAARSGADHLWKGCRNRPDGKGLR